MNHRRRSQIRQRLPEIPESWITAGIGTIAVVMLVYFLVFFFFPALEAAMEQ